MLTEIYCEAFGEEKRIAFFPGLNTIQGLINELDSSGGNSIGKTSILKIIDYAFGGKYYAQSNDDIIRHVGEHDICFTYTFNSSPYYFRRSASKPDIVLRCADSKYIPQSEMSTQNFCKWLVEQYGLQELHLTFREIISLYSRVWNKPNKEVRRPLYNYNAQTVKNAIISLVKLFDKYSPVQELHEHDDYLQKRSQALSKAVSYHLLQIPTKAEHTRITNELLQIQETITLLRANIAVASNENSEYITEQYNKLYEQRTVLLNQHGRTKRALQRCARNMQTLAPLSDTTFSPLVEFFPEININRIREVQKFHDNLRAVLLDELKCEESRLQQHLDEIANAISSNEHAIQDMTELPTQAAAAMDKMLKLTRRQEQLQVQLELYDDKSANAAQRVENNKTLSKLLSSITTEIQNHINEKISEYSKCIATSNSKAPTLRLSDKEYEYGVEDNTGTGKAYTDLILFDLAVMSLTKLPILIHDSFLFNNIDNITKQSLLQLYSQFSNKQIFISLDQYLGSDNEEIDKILYSSTRLVLSGRKTLFGQDWRTL